MYNNILLFFISHYSYSLLFSTDTTIQQKNKRRGGETLNFQPKTTQPPLQPISIVDNPPQKLTQNQQKIQLKIRLNPPENLTHNQPKPFEKLIPKPKPKSIKTKSNRTYMKNPTKNPYKKPNGNQSDLLPLLLPDLPCCFLYLLASTAGISTLMLTGFACFHHRIFYHVWVLGLIYERWREFREYPMYRLETWERKRVEGVPEAKKNWERKGKTRLRWG